MAEVVPLGYVDAKGFHKPKSLPAQFAAVSAPTDTDLAFLRERMGDVEVGRLRSGEDTIELPVGIRGETLPSHGGVCAGRMSSAWPATHAAAPVESTAQPSGISDAIRNTVRQLIDP